MDFLRALNILRACGLTVEARSENQWYVAYPQEEYVLAGLFAPSYLLRLAQRLERRCFLEPVSARRAC